MSLNRCFGEESRPGVSRLLIAAAVFLSGFVANVVIGASSGSPPLGVVWELLLLLGASVAFTAAILRREAAARGAPPRHNDDP